MTREQAERIAISASLASHYVVITRHPWAWRIAGRVVDSKVSYRYILDPCTSRYRTDSYFPTADDDAADDWMVK